MICEVLYLFSYKTGVYPSHITTILYVNQSCIRLCYKLVSYFQNNPIDLDPSCEMDLDLSIKMDLHVDLLDWSGREKLLIILTSTI